MEMSFTEDIRSLGKWITSGDHFEIFTGVDSLSWNIGLSDILLSFCSLQEADLGFHLIVDRRKDRWTSVKSVLLKISVYFPGVVHVVYVVRPAGFFQKAISEVRVKNLCWNFGILFLKISMSFSSGELKVLQGWVQIPPNSVFKPRGAPWPHF